MLTQPPTNYGSSSSISTDYSGVTETPGNLVSREAASMALSRYEIVRQLAGGCWVLELACGSGQGLGYVAERATRVIGGDITAGLVAKAHAHYQGSIPVLRFDAHDLPFQDASFDVVQIHEAIYYMTAPQRVFAECRRVLRGNGVLFVSSINPEWADFNPSPHATGYLSAGQLRALLVPHFPSVEIGFGFEIPKLTLTQMIMSGIKQTAVSLRLIPNTMRGKAFLKRVFLGPLVEVPAQLTDTLAAFQPPINAPDRHSSAYKIVYATARL